MRKIDKIILHSSATPDGREHTVADIEGWHKARGFAKIGYHYVLYLDGSVHKGRNETEVGSHCLGFNTNSIGVCYVGGTDAAGKPKDTRTAAQKASLLKLVAELKVKYPSASVHGHKEFAAKACPSFDVKKEFRL